MKQAVILAAGRGQRLTDASNGVPKCLVEVGGTTLIERQLDLLHEVGIERACAVVGYRGEHVREVVGDRCDVIANERYAETNSLYSLWLTREWVRGSFVLLNCDVLAHPDIYHRVMAVNGSALAYDGSSGHDDEHMKVCVDGNRVRALDKELEPGRVSGENVGILQFDERGSAVVLDEADRLVGAGATGAWAPTAVDRACARIEVRGIDVGDLPWTEIDFPEDLRSARSSVWPTIELGRWVLENGRSARVPGRTRRAM